MTKVTIETKIKAMSLRHCYTGMDVFPIAHTRQKKTKIIRAQKIGKSAD